MAVISSAVPYFVLVSLLVACVPGIYWLYKRFTSRKDANRMGQRQISEDLRLESQPPAPSSHQLENQSGNASDCGVRRPENEQHKSSSNSDDLPRPTEPDLGPQE